MSFKIVSFETIKPMWESPEMWGKDPFKPVSSMLYYDGSTYLGGNDLSVYEPDNYPIFMVYEKDGVHTGVISWFQIQNTVRFRGLYVKPDYRKEGIAEMLLVKATLESACMRCKFGWALAGPNSIRVHEKAGFRRITQQMHHMPDGNVSKHENCYMRYNYNV